MEFWGKHVDLTRTQSLAELTRVMRLSSRLLELFILKKNDQLKHLRRVRYQYLQQLPVSISQGLKLLHQLQEQLVFHLIWISVPNTVDMNQNTLYFC